jgi:signal transduction histidine kinase
MNSFLGVPIVGRRGVFGNLYLTEKTGGRLFTDDDEYIAVLLATMCGAAVEKRPPARRERAAAGGGPATASHRERFFAMVNHELRNALAAVYGWSEMLVRKKDPATVPPAAFEVLDSAQQAVGLINDLLDLSRLDEDRLKPVIRAVEPGAIARRAVGRLTRPPMPRILREPRDTAEVAQRRNRRQSGGTDPGESPRERHQARAGPEHGACGHRCHRKGNRLSVTDEGPGIPDADWELIFDIYVTRTMARSRGSAWVCPCPPPGEAAGRRAPGHPAATGDRPRRLFRAPTSSTPRMMRTSS